MPTAQFIVQVRAPGVVAFRNVANPNQYLDPTGDELDTCPGHHAADVRVTEHGTCTCVLEYMRTYVYARRYPISRLHTL